MILTEKEVERFYTIWFPLLHFVNQRRKLVSSFPKVWKVGPPPTPEMVLPLRNALWEDDSLREAFIAENPAHLSHSDLTLVESWTHRIQDRFFIFRHLKKYSVFIDDSSPARVFGVLGIISPLEEVIGPYLPVYVDAVILPFEDRIIYDSLLSPYSIYFGSGYRSSLKGIYQDVQERGGIITRLPASETAADITQVAASNKKVLTAFQKALGASGLSPKMIQEHSDNVAEFAEQYLHKKSSPTMLLDITEQDIKAYRALRKGDIKLTSFKRFVWFLRDSGRMDWNQIDALLSYLKEK